ncbi:hypothetical protein ACIRBX_12365 [Kitasatospora sp. NPDC096147]|uniref:hypothetical protein n=1 Tax=Kitasatospora sp. NPDC096147 TaxID=3364093 RepID=UPI0038103130
MSDITAPSNPTDPTDHKGAERRRREARLAEIAQLATAKQVARTHLEALDARLRRTARAAYSAGAYWHEIATHAGVSTETARHYRYDLVDGIPRNPTPPMAPRTIRERGE